MQSPTIRQAMPREEAIAFFAVIYGGAHHIPGKLAVEGLGWKLQHWGQLSTYDFDLLTRLVLLAHDRCVRVSIQQGGPKRVAIVLHKRDPKGQDFSERHPTIAQALMRWRESNPLPASAPTAPAAPPPARPWRDVLELNGDTVTSAAVERAFSVLSAGWREDSERFIELRTARDDAKHELCFEHDQSNWGG